MKVEPPAKRVKQPVVKHESLLEEESSNTSSNDDKEEEMSESDGEKAEGSVEPNPECAADEDGPVLKRSPLKGKKPGSFRLREAANVVFGKDETDEFDGHYGLEDVLEGAELAGQTYGDDEAPDANLRAQLKEINILVQEAVGDVDAAPLGDFRKAGPKLGVDDFGGEKDDLDKGVQYLFLSAAEDGTHNRQVWRFDAVNKFWKVRTDQVSVEQAVQDVNTRTVNMTAEEYKRVIMDRPKPQPVERAARQDRVAGAGAGAAPGGARAPRANIIRPGGMERVMRQPKVDEDTALPPSLMAVRDRLVPQNSQGPNFYTALVQGDDLYSTPNTSLAGERNEGGKSLLEWQDLMYAPRQWKAMRFNMHGPDATAEQIMKYKRRHAAITHARLGLFMVGIGISTDDQAPPDVEPQIIDPAHHEGPLLL